MTPTLEQRAEETVRNIEHYGDLTISHVQWAKNQVLAALRQTREEALEEAAEIVERKPTVQNEGTDREQFAKSIRALASGLGEK